MDVLGDIKGDTMGADYFLGILGIVISVIFFLIGYRQTIGAKKERIISANTEIEKILVRRVVLENYTPQPQDINRIIEGKARDFRVKSGDLYSSAQILTNIFTRIIESDFITQAQREAIITRLSAVMMEAETTPVQEEEIIEPTTPKQYVISKLPPITLAILASFVGSLITVIPDLWKAEISEKEILSAIMAVSTLSFVAIIFVYYLKRIRESQEETTLGSRSQLLNDYLEFEKQVVGIIKKSGGEFLPSKTPRAGFDFKIKINKRVFLIEVKSLTRNYPTIFTTGIMQRLAETVEREGADEGILVSNKSVEIDVAEIRGKPIKIMGLKDFKKYLMLHSLNE